MNLEILSGSHNYRQLGAAIKDLDLREIVRGFLVRLSDDCFFPAHFRGAHGGAEKEKN